MDVAGGKFYWADELSGIQRANLDGTSRETIVASAGVPVALDLTAGKVYWGTGTDIRRANLDGTSAEIVFSGEGAGGLDVDPSEQKIYFSNSGGGKIRRVNYDGTGAVDLVTGQNSPSRLEVDTGDSPKKIYWMENNGALSNVWRSNIDGSGAVEIVGTGLDAGSGLAIIDNPEPSSLLLASLGGLLACIIRRNGHAAG